MTRRSMPAYPSATAERVPAPASRPGFTFAACPVEPVSTGRHLDLESETTVEIQRPISENQPGDALLTSRSALDTATRFSDWLDVSALPAELVLADPLISVPVSQASAGSDGTPRCPTTVNPEVMWHWLGWLPGSLACRCRVEAEDGTFRVGPDTEWVLRLALELSLSSLDDLDLGTWLDVLPVCFDHPPCRRGSAPG